MGPNFVLIAWAVLAFVPALAAGLVLGGLAVVLTRRVEEHEARAIRLTAMILPLASVAWFFVIVIGQGAVNAAYLQRDRGYGDVMYAPLPHGYAVRMQNASDYGTLCRAGDLDEPCTGDQGGLLAGVTRLQVADRYLLGAGNAHLADFTPPRRENPDTFFLLDTANGETAEFVTFAQLTAAAAKLHIAPKLEPIADIYNRYHATWLDPLCLVVALAPAPLGLLLLVLWIVRARRRVTA